MSAPNSTRASAPSKPSVASHWALSSLMLLAIGTAAAGLNSVIADVTWWFIIMTVAMLVLVAGATVRSFARRRIWPVVAAVVTAFAAITLIFAPGQSLLALIPTPDTVERFGQLQEAGGNSISTQSIPANADEGILFLLCVGIAAIAVAMDILAFAVRAPALTGLPLLVLLIVPSAVRPELENGFFFLLTASAWIAILLVRSPRPGRRVAVGIAAVAVTAGLIVPLALPPLASTTQTGGTAAGLSTGINPIITLGDDLRRGEASLALRYTSTDPDGLYLRLTALDDFSGRSWVTSNTDTIESNEVDAIGGPPGLGEAVPVTPVTTEVTVANILSRWLPAPYAPSSVSGLVGQWSWEPDALAIRTERSSARGQQYTVESLRIAPSIDQLVAAGTTLEPGFDRYLALPDDLPSVVGSTALEVTAGAATNYDKALALQDYFRGGEFFYSEDAPVENGYDGSGASVLEAFLAAKSGYCVHFSSAMASMARTLGIPARVAVGFTPGQGTVQDDGTTEYTVTTFNLHAWPELYFAGIGWVRFEPTPGRGFVPEFAPLAVDDPATPEVDESVPPPVPTVGPTTAPSLPPEEDPALNDPQSVGPGAASTPAPWWILVVAGLIALLVAPGVVRAVRRARRLQQVSDGSAAAAWDELRDTADDLGLRTDSGRTPRQLSDDLAPHLSARGAEALGRLRAALEAEAFAEHAGAPRAGDVRAVIASLRRTSGVRASLAATFAPRSLVARWLPEPARP
ncbi:MAG: transglutaminase domain-containing protein [Salinibacterium sp.]|nr:transglutaminase domain-containing protein [Salinibacterium sp.]